MTRRLLKELRRSHAGADIDRALASLSVRVDADTAIVTREPGTPLFDAPPLRADVVRIEPRVYARTPSADARVRLLETAATLAPRVQVHAPTVSDGTYRGRLAIDLPRRAARALGVRAAEPGDRFDEHFAHAFFDDEAIIEEAARARLRFVARHRAWVMLERIDRGGRHEHEAADPFAQELVRAAAIARKAERLRWANAPELAVNTMRARGRTKKKRGPIGRARLRRAIGWIDATYPSGPNCFRRILIELGLDAGAAAETIVFGLDVGRTGHVAFEESEDRTFDVAFELTPG
jgi:hypothetical protein